MHCNSIILLFTPFCIYSSGDEEMSFGSLAQAGGGGNLQGSSSGLGELSVSSLPTGLVLSCIQYCIGRMQLTLDWVFLKADWL